MKTKINVDSTVNQQIKGDFVAREVKACFSYEMEAILNSAGGIDDAGLCSWDDVENLYQEICPDCEEPLEYEGQGRCPHCKSSTLDKDVDQVSREIFEWWIVTEYLYNKLKAKGEPVLEWGNNYYWGRTTTGQAILLDGVISDICQDMGILDGQKYSWAKDCK